LADLLRPAFLLRLLNCLLICSRAGALVRFPGQSDVLPPLVSVSPNCSVRRSVFVSAQERIASLVLDL
jgi:hypothetical protein